MLPQAIKKAWFKDVPRSTSWLLYDSTFGAATAGAGLIMLQEVSKDGTLADAVSSKNTAPPAWVGTDAGKLSALLQVAFAINSVHSWGAQHNDLHAGNIFLQKVQKDPCVPRATAGTCEYWCYRFGTGFQLKPPSVKCVEASATDSTMLRMGDFGSWYQKEDKPHLGRFTEAGSGSMPDALSVKKACMVLFGKDAQTCKQLETAPSSGGEIEKNGCDAAASVVFEQLPSQPPEGKTVCWFGANTAQN